MKTYYVSFSSGDPRTFTGLQPTFLIFQQSNGTTLTPPSIAEVNNSGIYSFSWGTTTSISFLVDAATTGPGSNARYITGDLAQSDRIDEYGNTLVAIGNTGVGYGTSIYALVNTFNTQLLAIGSTASAFGDSVTSPVDLFGYLKRVRELLEGNQTFIKGAPATLNQYDRTGNTLLISKSITNNVSLVIKS